MRKYIVANWKMYVGNRESIALSRGVLSFLRGKTQLPEIILCPSFPALNDVHKIIAKSRMKLGAQNVFWQENGAYTGEVSASMLAELGCQYVLVGHSERKEHLGETEEMIQKKMQAVWQQKLIPICCVGESFEQYQKGNTFVVLKKQIENALHFIPRNGREILLAYEPCWAISTQKKSEVSVKEVVEVLTQIQAFLQQTFSEERAKKIHLIYGGSVEKNTAYSFLREPIVEGILVGQASIKIHQFLEIIQASCEVLEGQP